MTSWIEEGRPTPFAATAAIGVAAFLAVAVLMNAGALNALDLRLLAWTADVRTDALTPAVLQITALGNALTVAVIAVLAAAMLAAYRRAAEGLFVLVSTGGGIALQAGLKAVIGRPRPDPEAWLAPVMTPAFPSGHAVNAAALCVALAVVAWHLPLAVPVRRLLGAALLTMAMLVGASRSWLAVHYPSDVVAGLALGTAWAAFCAATIRHRRASVDRAALAD